jgi:hypothetical protein
LLVCIGAGLCARVLLNPIGLAALVHRQELALVRIVVLAQVVAVGVRGASVEEDPLDVRGDPAVSAGVLVEG